MQGLDKAGGPRARVTIRGLATRLGVSSAAVSFALNGKPGVSEATRERILAAADELGWQPSAAARALSGSGIGSIGLVLARDADDLARDAFYLKFLAGVQEDLSAHDLTLTFQLVPDLAAEQRVYRKWFAQQRVDGVIVVDLRQDDPRPALLEELGLPAVLVGAAEHAQGALPAVWAEDEGPTRALVDELVSLGHSRIGYICGPLDLAHTRHRVAAYQDAMVAAGCQPLPVVASHYRVGEACKGLDELLANDASAVVVDSEQLALGVLRRAAQRNLRIPEDLSVLSWEDGAVCEATTPGIASLRRDAFGLGRGAGRVLRARMKGEQRPVLELPQPQLIRRGSLGHRASGGTSS